MEGELEKYRRQTQEQLAQVLEALPWQDLEAFDTKAKHSYLSKTMALVLALYGQAQT